MKKITPWLILLVVLLAPVGFLYLYYPVHDFIGRRNTAYSSPSTAEGIARVTNGMSRTTVIELLGAPLGTAVLPTNYPPWAEGIETLGFSRPKRAGDYEVVSVWIGPGQKVMWHGRAVTD